jgi:hypothetical protein
MRLDCQLQEVTLKISTTNMNLIKKSNRTTGDKSVFDFLFFKELRRQNQHYKNS